MPRLFLTLFLFAAAPFVAANNPYFVHCEKGGCDSCTTSSCEPGDSTYVTSATFRTDKEVSSYLSDMEQRGYVCSVKEILPNSGDGTNPEDNTNPDDGDSDSGVTAASYSRASILFSGVTPDYVRSETIGGKRLPKHLGRNKVQGRLMAVDEKWRCDLKLVMECGCCVYQDTEFGLPLKVAEDFCGAVEAQGSGWGDNKPVAEAAAYEQMISHADVMCQELDCPINGASVPCEVTPQPGIQNRVFDAIKCYKFRVELWQQPDGSLHLFYYQIDPPIRKPIVS